MSAVPGTLRITSSTWFARSINTSGSSPKTWISTAPAAPPPNIEDNTKEMVASGIFLTSGRSALTMSVVLRSRSFLSTTCTKTVAVLAVPPPPKKLSAPPPEPTRVKMETVSGTCSRIMRSACRAAWSVAWRLVPGGISMVTVNLASSSWGKNSVPTTPLMTINTPRATEAAATSTASDWVRKFLSTKRMVAAYRLVRAPNPNSHKATNPFQALSTGHDRNPSTFRKPRGLDSGWLSSFIHCAANIGVNVKETNRENSTAVAMVTPYDLKNWPMIPLVKATGT